MITRPRSSYGNTGGARCRRLVPGWGAIALVAALVFAATELRRGARGWAAGTLLARGTGTGGRPKETPRRRCRELITEGRGLEFVAGVMAGTEMERQAVSVKVGGRWQAPIIETPPKLRDRLLAFELLADRGWGKPNQALQVEEEWPRPTGEEHMARIVEHLPRIVALLAPEQRAMMALTLEEQRRIEALMQGNGEEM